jgi:aminocarboxymuconate-semialdehyde decarboxylase
MLKIDMHSHIVPEHLPRWADKFGYGGFIHLESQGSGTAWMMKGEEKFRLIQSNCWDPEERIAEYAERGVTVQVVCTIPVLFSYWAKPLDAWDIARFLNDHLVELVGRYPERYIGLATLPMQDTALAIRELERCHALGLPGIQIGSNINDLNLNEPVFLPIFEACQELGMAVFVHPWNMMGFEHMRRYWLPWLVGMPAETARAVCSMIFGGIFEKLPKLRVCFAHAGGSFLPTIGRIQHGFDCRPDLVAVDNNIPPREYLGKFWVDGITHDAALLRYILDMVGDQRVCLGSDYPFPLGDLTIGAFIDEMGLSEESRKRIYATNTLEWLGLNPGKYGL